MGIVSLLLILASGLDWWPLPMTEVLGFVTGGICVWLVVRQHMWNWPIGILNNIFFFVLFYQARLFADMGLQVVYLALGLYGWWNWRYGGEKRTELRVSDANFEEWLTVLVLLPIFTWAMHGVLVLVNGASPFWDALTTALSLAAQFLLCRKKIENWFFWIAADIIYIPLYVSRGLPLTAILYGVFLTMCLVGVWQWGRALRDRPEAAGEGA